MIDNYNRKLLYLCSAKIEISPIINNLLTILNAKDEIMSFLASATGLDTESSQGRLEALMPSGSECSELLVAVSPGDYSASHVARAVEDCDAHLLNLNVTGARTGAGEPVVHLRISGASARSVVASVERHGHRVIAYTGGSLARDDEENRRRVAELLHLINM